MDEQNLCFECVKTYVELQEFNETIFWGLWFYNVCTFKAQKIVSEKRYSLILIILFMLMYFIDTHHINIYSFLSLRNNKIIKQCLHKP